MHVNAHTVAELLPLPSNRRSTTHLLVGHLVRRIPCGTIRTGSSRDKSIPKLYYHLIAFFLTSPSHPTISPYETWRQ